MKKVGILFVAVGLIFSCTNVKESKEYKDLESQRDSLLALSSSSNTELAEMMAVISEVEANFDKIREAEKYLSTESTTTGEMNKNTKTRVEDNFKMISEILEKNKAQLAELNKKYKGSNAQVASLKNTIERLNQEMQERANRLTELQEELAKRDETITELSSNLTQLSEQSEAQSATIKQQDKALHTAYYVFGTSKELKDQKILSGGFLKSTKVLDDTFNKDYFLKIDIREVTEIPLYAKKAKVWSNHPDGTYEFVKGDDNNLTFHITDTQRFWSLSKYLIIEVS
ncbi:MAG: hypothetical protein LBR48_02465 [Dysgonamonadaceae bacterium]|jgi:phage-related tail protein|nr:hypothetical protein [Dysgonamonadaceae bacterium]